MRFGTCVGMSLACLFTIGYGSVIVVNVFTVYVFKITAYLVVDRCFELWLPYFLCIRVDRYRSRCPRGLSGEAFVRERLSGAFVLPSVSHIS